MDSTRCFKNVVMSRLKLVEVEFSRERLATPEAWITAILLRFVDAIRKNSWEMQQYRVSRPFPELIVMVHEFLSEVWLRCLFVCLDFEETKRRQREYLWPLGVFV